MWCSASIRDRQARPDNGAVCHIVQLVVDHLRATRRHRADVPIEDADQVTAPDVHEAAEASLDLSAMLGRLPARTRALIEATKIEGIGTAEAGERTGMSEDAVKMTVHRGLKRLAELFGRPGPP